MSLQAYFITWTTYGTWLHGDNRGSAADIHGKSISIEASPARIRWSADLMSENQFTLDDKAQRVVVDVIQRHAQHRKWQIDALNVRSNHVHVVVRAPGYQPEIVASQFKSWATRELRKHGHIDQRERVWTKKASTRWIRDAESHAKAVDYVLNHQ